METQNLTFILFRRSCFWLIWITIFFGCNNLPDYKLNTNVLKFTHGTFDAEAVIGDDFKIVGDKIRNGKLLIKATAGQDSSFFIITDIRSKKIVNKVKDPTNDYVASSFDCDGDKLVCFNALNANIYLKDLKNPNSGFSVLDNFLPSKADDIVLNNSQIYLTGDVYGVSLADVKHKGHFFFKDTTGVNSLLGSVVSYPLSDSLNILSGQNALNGKTKLRAVDSKNHIRWSYLIDENKTLSETIVFNFSDLFVVAQNKKLIALDKKTGREVWDKDYDENISKAYKTGDKILITSIVHDREFPVEDDPCRIFLKLIESKNGVVNWEKYINTRGNAPSIGICNNNLLLSDNRRFTVYDLPNGKVKFKTTFSRSEENNYAFITITDFVTGIHYLKSYDDIYYW